MAQMVAAVALETTRFWIVVAADPIVVACAALVGTSPACSPDNLTASDGRAAFSAVDYFAAGGGGEVLADAVVLRLLSGVAVAVLVVALGIMRVMAGAAAHVATHLFVVAIAVPGAMDAAAAAAVRLPIVIGDAPAEMMAVIATVGLSTNFLKSRAVAALKDHILLHPKQLRACNQWLRAHSWRAVLQS